MDTFIDKLAQKRSTQEMILANMTAEAAKVEQMQNQMKAYDEMMQEIRRINLKTAMDLSKVQETLDEYMDKLEDMLKNYAKDDETKQSLGQIKEQLENYAKDDETKQSLGQIKEQLENYAKDDETKQSLEQIKEQLENYVKDDEIKQSLEQFKKLQEEKFSQSNDFLHKENVKVYRNVQAAVVEELGKQTEELKQSQKENRGSKAVLPISILILIAVLADVAVHVYEVISPYINMKLF